MEQLFIAFFDVFLFPVNPEFLDFENNPIMLMLCMILLGIGITGFVRRWFFEILNWS